MQVASTTVAVMDFHYIVVLLILYCTSNVLSADITPVQFKKTQQILRNICQARFKVSDAEIESLRLNPDSFDDDSQEKCYATCVLEMLNLVIDGRIPTELAHKSIVIMLPDEMKDITIDSLEKCRSFLTDEPNNLHCIVGHKMFKCLTDNNLNFVFV